MRVKIVQSLFAILQLDNPPQLHINMRSFVVLALFVAVAVAVPIDPKDAKTEEFVNDNIGVGPYNYAYKTSDGKFAEESGNLKNVGTENEALEVRGQYAYVGPDGVTYTVTYVANEAGFQPSGAHLPVPV